MTPASVNCAQLIGSIMNISKIHHTKDGKMTVRLTIATLSTSPDEETGSIERHKVVIFNQRLAKFAEQHLYKGDHVFIEGNLQTRQWKDKKGQLRRLTEVIVSGHNGKLFLICDESGDYEGLLEDGGYGVIDSHRCFAEMDEEDF